MKKINTSGLIVARISSRQISFKRVGIVVRVSRDEAAVIKLKVEHVIVKLELVIIVIITVATIVKQVIGS